VQIVAAFIFLQQGRELPSPKRKPKKQYDLEREETKMNCTSNVPASCTRGEYDKKEREQLSF
jgi:hypothetical protein